VTRIAARLQIDGRPLTPAGIRWMIDSAADRRPLALATWTDCRVGLTEARDGTAGDNAAPLIETRGALALAWDGRLDDRADLCDQLDQIPTLSDAGLVLTAFERWGAACFERLVGDFAFVLWDGAARRLIAARDHLGIRPLHYATDGRAWFLASRTDQLRRAGFGRTIDETMVGDFLIGRIDAPSRTFYQGIHRLPPGHLLELSAGNDIIVRAYWTPPWDRTLSYRHESEYTEHFAGLFKTAVGCRLTPDGPAGLLLSGGLDSTAIAVSASEAGASALALGPLPTITATFEEIHEPHESQQARRIVDEHKLEGHFVAGDPAWTFGLAESARASWDEPLEGMYVITLRRLIAGAREQGVRVLLTGFGGDLVLTGNYYYLYELLAAHRWSACRRELASYPLWRRAWLAVNYMATPLLLGRPRQPRPYEIPRWIPQGFATRIDLPARRRPAVPLLPTASVSQRAEAQAINIVEHSTRLLWQQSEGLRAGIELRHPFLDRRLFEFLLRVPVTQKIVHGRPKTLLRQAVPAAVIPASRAPRMRRRLEDGMQAVRARERADWAACFAEPQTAALGYVDPVQLGIAFARYLDGDGRLKYPLARTYRLERWLQRLLGDTRT
jgi:asparagine synthase (glutamine-hydrolysing)